MNEILELEEKSRALEKEKKDNSQYCNKSLLEFQAVVKIKKCDIFGAEVTTEILLTKVVRPMLRKKCTRLKITN